MCGIVGYFSIAQDGNPKNVARANNMVRYRGPDDYGYMTLDKNGEVKEWQDEWMRDFPPAKKIKGILGFRRLSILDLSSKGHQPMHEGEFRYWIVFNGEVYNYVEIQKELVARGYHFRSKTDTEVILKSYVEWGYDCLKKFNGMWSFCIFDTRERKLFCARDRLGIKPFYYYFDGTHFIFGSEVKQVLSLLPFDPEMNPTVFFDYLALGSYGNETEETFFKSVYKMLPGEYMEIRLSDPRKLILKKRIWWDLPSCEEETYSDEDKIYETISYLLEDSIRLRLRSDVPVGTCLSGGLDSSGILSLVDRICKKTNNAHKHKVFVIGSINPEIDETHYARLMIENTNVEPFFKFLKPMDLERELDTFIWHHDEPLLTASIFGGWFVYKLAKNGGATVVLDGQGSDELLGGYYCGPHIDFLHELLVSGKIAEFFRQLNANSTLHAVGKSLILKKLLRNISKQIARSIVPADFRPNVYRSVQRWLKLDFVEANIVKSHALHKDFYPQSRKFSSRIKRQSYELTRFTNLPGILRQVDRNSMAFSVEARVPFLDFRLVEYLFKLPSRLILRNGYTKYVYRESMKGILPEKIRLRTDKRGFTMPDRDLLNGAMTFVNDIIERIPSNSVIYDVENIKKRIAAYIGNEQLYHPIIWRIINAIIWQSKFQLHECS